jgi:hypothetical protein
MAAAKTSPYERKKIEIISKIPKDEVYDLILQEIHPFDVKRCRNAAGCPGLNSAKAFFDLQCSSVFCYDIPWRGRRSKVIIV